MCNIYRNKFFRTSALCTRQSRTYRRRLVLEKNGIFGTRDWRAVVRLWKGAHSPYSENGLVYYTERYFTCDCGLADKIFFSRHI